MNSTTNNSAAYLVKALGLVSSALSIVNLAPQPLIQNASLSNSSLYTLGVSAGQIDGGSSMVGNNTNDTSEWMPEIALQSPRGGFIGQTSPSGAQWIALSNGSLVGLESFGQASSQPAVEVGSLMAMQRNNSICLSSLQLYEPNATRPVVLLGDMLAFCGAPTFPSNTQIAVENTTTKTVESQYVDCAWLNLASDDSATLEQTLSGWVGFAINDFPYFASVRDGTVNASTMGIDSPSNACAKLSAYQGTAAANKSLSLANQLITTSRRIARSTCENRKSLGQSIYSTSEQVVCDMRTKTIRPVCKEAGASEGDVECYQVGSDEFVTSGVSLD